MKKSLNNVEEYEKRTDLKTHNNKLLQMIGKAKGQDEGNDDENVDYEANFRNELFSIKEEDEELEKFSHQTASVQEDCENDQAIKDNESIWDPEKIDQSSLASEDNRIGATILLQSEFVNLREE